MNAIVIGIAGGTGSGKSTMIRNISRKFGESIALLSHDFYYKAHDDMPYEERCKLNYDHPDAFDSDMFIEDIKKLRAGEPIFRPVYDFTIHNRVEEVVEVKPAKVLIVEGILIFAEEKMREMFDIKLYIDTDPDVRILRRIMRDVKHRGRSL